jgi:two-component system, NarL family, response regulator NreC
VSIRVLIADDHPVVREGLKRTLNVASGEIIIVAEAANGKDVLNFSRQMPIDVYILDICMPELNGLETLVRLRRARPESKVILLSMLDSRSTVENAFRSGAMGYLLKENSAADVVQAVREVNKGRFFISPAIAGFVVAALKGENGSPPRHEPAACLTSRERECVQLIAEGFSSKEIATKLALSVNTVRVHRRNIMEKLGAHCQADVTRFALKEGIAGLWRSDPGPDRLSAL